MTSEYIAKRAKKVLRRAGTRDMLQVARELNIHIQFNHYEELLGMYFVVLRSRFISINEDLENEMLQMVLAHEIGHDQLHRDIAKHSGLQEFQLFDIPGKCEYEANAFAAHLLLDTDEVRYYLKQGYDVVQTAQMMNCNANLMLIKVNEMNVLESLV